MLKKVYRKLLKNINKINIFSKDKVKNDVL